MSRVVWRARWRSAVFAGCGACACCSTSRCQSVQVSGVGVLQVKCLRVLQYFPPPEDPAVAKTLNEVLARIITGSDAAKNVNKNNAQHAIVFEAIALALALEADPDLLTAGERWVPMLRMQESDSWQTCVVKCTCAAHIVLHPQRSGSPLFLLCIGG